MRSSLVLYIGIFLFGLLAYSYISSNQESFLPQSESPKLDAVASDVWAKSDIGRPVLLIENKVDLGEEADTNPHRFIVTVAENQTSKNKRVKLNGDVPDSESHQSIISAVKKAFPNSTISDRLYEVSNAPKGWLETAKSGLMNLALLESGSVELVDNIMSMTGKARTHNIVKQVTSNSNTQMSDHYLKLYTLTVMDDKNSQ